ncbi:MAG: hypothetical protein LBV73_13770 [Paraburkholderia sp.]|jgi:hypothetical protein|nr:hypothetical protein [Paraburkholderia sp.]
MQFTLRVKRDLTFDRSCSTEGLTMRDLLVVDAERGATFSAKTKPPLQRQTLQGRFS